MRAEAIGLDPGAYSSHPLHHPERALCRTNSAVDLWVELLHALGHDPVSGLGFTLSCGFDGAHWRMAGFPPDVLHGLYGIEVGPLNLRRPLQEHLAMELAIGHLVLFDVDAWWLPDTAGRAYHRTHRQTTVCAQMVDVAGGRLGYFHDTGYYELDGDDFDGLLRACPDVVVVPPRARQIRPGKVPALPTLLALRALAATQLRRSEPEQPISRLAQRVDGDLERLRVGGIDVLRQWGFGTLSQCGATANLAAAHLQRLAPGPPGAVAIARFRDLSDLVTSVLMALDRTAQGPPVEGPAVHMAAVRCWDEAVEMAAEELGVEAWERRPLVPPMAVR